MGELVCSGATIEDDGAWCSGTNKKKKIGDGYCANRWNYSEVKIDNGKRPELMDLLQED
jgi:hypothetical protein